LILFLGKEGRFRGNLSGKRVDFSGRTVISPDANCPIPEVIIPMWSAKRLTFPERVCELTIDKLRAAVLRGADEWPGALFVIKKDAGKTSLHFGNRRQIANNLQYGDTVERHLWDGDIVLFNRQVRFHGLFEFSIMYVTSLF
jgi:DNA-directed RNA polymerase III subunit RPC1